MTPQRFPSAGDPVSEDIGLKQPLPCPFLSRVESVNLLRKEIERRQPVCNVSALLVYEHPVLLFAIATRTWIISTHMVHLQPCHTIGDIKHILAYVGEVIFNRQR